MNNLSRNSIRRWLTLTALVVIAIAIILTGLAGINPSLLAIFHYPRDDVLLITGFLVVATLGISLLLQLHLISEDADTDTYEPEITPDIRYPGADLESLTASPFLGYRIPEDEQSEIRTRLKEATVNMIRRHTGIREDDAKARVQRGNWTENQTAAWFLGETPPPRSVRLYARVSDAYAFRHGARQAIHEIVAYEQRHEDTEARSL